MYLLDVRLAQEMPCCSMLNLELLLTSLQTKSDSDLNQISRKKGEIEREKGRSEAKVRA